VALARARLDLAQHRVAVAQLGLQPDLSAGAGLASRRDLDPVVLLEFGVEIPLWRRDKQQPLVRAAELERDAAQAELTNATTAAHAQAVAIQTAWANAEAQIARYREGILPQSATALDAARGAYLAGEGAFATVVGAFRRWLDVRLALTRRQRDQFVAERQWVELFGPEESEDG
jgi:outer membrane protein TolC